MTTDEIAALAKKKPPPCGTYCPACRDTGLSHCSDPANCGGMIPWPTTDKEKP